MIVPGGELLVTLKSSLVTGIVLKGCILAVLREIDDGLYLILGNTEMQFVFSNVFEIEGFSE